MADNRDLAAPRHGEMSIGEHAETYGHVMGLFKWCALGVADLLILLVMWFCTPAGFFSALVVAAIVLGLGLVGLRSRPADH